MDAGTLPASVAGDGIERADDIHYHALALGAG